KPAEDQQTEDEGVTEREEPPTPARSHLPILDDEPEEPEAPAESQKPAEPETPVEPEPQNEQDRTQVVPPVTSGQPQAAAASVGPSSISPLAAGSVETPYGAYAIHFTDAPQCSALARSPAVILLVAGLVGAGTV